MYEDHSLRTVLVSEINQLFHWVVFEQPVILPESTLVGGMSHLIILTFGLVNSIPDARVERSGASCAGNCELRAKKEHGQGCRTSLNPRSSA